MGKLIKWTLIIAVVAVSVYSLYHLLKTRGEKQVETSEA